MQIWVHIREVTFWMVVYSSAILMHRWPLFVPRVLIVRHCFSALVRITATAMTTDSWCGNLCKMKTMHNQKSNALIRVTCPVKCGWNYLSIPKLQRLHRWCLGMDKSRHPTLYDGCKYLSTLGSKLTNISIIKRANSVIMTLSICKIYNSREINTSCNIIIWPPMKHNDTHNGTYVNDTTYCHNMSIGNNRF